MSEWSPLVTYPGPITDFRREGNVVHATGRAAFVTASSEPEHYIARFCDARGREDEMHPWSTVTCPDCLAKRDAVNAQIEDEHLEPGGAA